MEQYAPYVFLLALITFVNSHPISTFTVSVTQINGTGTAGNFVAGQQIRIPFVIKDKWNDNAFVKSTNLISMHGRFIHVILVSEDLETFFHIHPEDFGSLATMSATGAYYVDVVLPKSGLWNLGAFFVYQNGNDLREGSGGDYVNALTGGVPPVSPHVYQYNTTKKFMQYPLPMDQNFNSPIDIRTNSDPAGYTVSITVGSKNATSDVRNITAGCQPITFKVLDKNGVPPKNMVPFLGAAAHIIFASEYDTVYHTHAMYLASYLNFDDDVVGMMKQMNMTMDEMKNLPMSSMLRIMMGATMIGVNPDGSINCLQDEAKAMQAMGMDFNTFYGTDTFGSDLITLFDFPQQGNWRGFVSFAVMEGNTTSLIVADFSLAVPNPPKFTYVIPTPPTKTATHNPSSATQALSSPSENPSSGSHLEILTLCIWLALVVFLQ